MSNPALERRVAHHDLGVARPRVGIDRRLRALPFSSLKECLATSSMLPPNNHMVFRPPDWGFRRVAFPQLARRRGRKRLPTAEGIMRTHLVQEHPSVVRAGTSRARSGSLLEVIAINLAWPLGLTRLVQGLMTAQPVHAVEGLAFFLLVFFYVLVRLYQLRRTD
jgi:hypothetical protein